MTYPHADAMASPHIDDRQLEQLTPVLKHHMPCLYQPSAGHTVTRDEINHVLRELRHSAPSEFHHHVETLEQILHVAQQYHAYQLAFRMTVHIREPAHARFSPITLIRSSLAHDLAARAEANIRNNHVNGGTLAIAMMAFNGIIDIYRYERMCRLSFGELIHHEELMYWRLFGSSAEPRTCRNTRLLLVPICYMLIVRLHDAGYRNLNEAMGLHLDHNPIREPKRFIEQMVSDLGDWPTAISRQPGASLGRIMDLFSAYLDERGIQPLLVDYARGAVLSHSLGEWDFHRTFSRFCREAAYYARMDQQPDATEDPAMAEQMAPLLESVRTFTDYDALKQLIRQCRPNTIRERLRRLHADSLVAIILDHVLERWRNGPRFRRTAASTISHQLVPLLPFLLEWFGQQGRALSEPAECYECYRWALSFQTYHMPLLHLCQGIHRFEQYCCRRYHQSFERPFIKADVPDVKAPPPSTGYLLPADNVDTDIALIERVPSDGRYQSNQLPNEQYALFQQLAYYTGMRPQEIVCLRLEDVRPGPNHLQGYWQIDVRDHPELAQSPKSHNGFRRILLHDCLPADVLERFIAWYEQRCDEAFHDNDMLFPSALSYREALPKPMNQATATSRIADEFPRRPDGTRPPFRINRHASATNRLLLVLDDLDPNLFAGTAVREQVITPLHTNGLPGNRERMSAEAHPEWVVDELGHQTGHADAEQTLESYGHCLDYALQRNLLQIQPDLTDQQISDLMGDRRPGTSHKTVNQMRKAEPYDVGIFRSRWCRQSHQDLQKDNNGDVH